MSLLRVDHREEIVSFFQDNPTRKGSLGEDFAFLCPREGQIRRAAVEVIQTFDFLNGVRISGPMPDTHRVLGIKCVNCKHQSIALLIQNLSDYQLIFVHKDKNYLGSPNANPEVKYYINQANNCHSVGANSASVAMFRAALEQLLYHNGFKDGMLNKKIKDLEYRIADGTAPDWAIKLDVGFLNIIKELGNSAIHPNLGDITIQDRLDSNLVAALQVTFSEILDLVYEEPIRRAERKNLLSVATSKKNP